jgi:tetratricopeptide (TPR) repeat protein
MLAPPPLGDADRAEGPPGGAAAAGPPGRPARVGAGLARLLRRRVRLLAAAALLALAAAGVAVAGYEAWAWYHLRAAREAVARFHNPQAVSHLKVCLRVWPDDPEVLLLAARAARRAHVYGDAALSLEKYQKVHGLDEAGSQELLLLSAERDVDSVADVCRRSVEEKRPDAPLILEAAANGYIRRYRLPEARACLDRWLQLQPDNPQALYLQGQIHLDLENDINGAAESYRRVVQLDPEHEEARVGLAVALLELKDYRGAAEQLEYMRRAQPDNLRVRVGLADCRDGLGDQAEALRLVDGVLAEEPQYGPALALRGRFALDAGDHATAESWLRRAVAVNPNDHQARYNLVLCLLRNGEEEEAARQQRELKQQEDDGKRLHEIIVHDMAQRPNDPELHCTVGQLLLRAGRREEGLRWLRSALELDPQYAPAREAVAEYQRQTESAQEHRE